MTLKVEAVVDRISEGKHAVILIESHGKEIVVDVREIDLALKAGDWLDLQLDDNDKIIEIAVNQRLTEEKASKIESVMDRLKKRKGSKYK